MGVLEGNLYFQEEGTSEPVEVTIHKFEHRYGYADPAQLLLTWQWPTYIVQISRIYWDDCASKSGDWFVRPAIVPEETLIPVRLVQQKSPDEETSARVVFAATDEYAFSILDQQGLNHWTMQVGESPAAIVAPNPIITDLTDRSYKALGFAAQRSNLQQLQIPGEAKLAMVPVNGFKAAIAAGLAERLANGDPSRIPAYVEFYRYSRQNGAALSGNNGLAAGNTHHAARYILTDAETGDSYEYYLYSPELIQNTSFVKFVLLRCDNQNRPEFLSQPTESLSVSVSVTGAGPFVAKFTNTSTGFQAIALDPGNGQPGVDLVANPVWDQLYATLPATAILHGIATNGEIVTQSIEVTP